MRHMSADWAGPSSQLRTAVKKAEPQGAWVFVCRVKHANFVCLFVLIEIHHSYTGLMHHGLNFSQFYFITAQLQPFLQQQQRIMV